MSVLHSDCGDDIRSSLRVELSTRIFKMLLKPTRERGATSLNDNRRFVQLTAERAQKYTSFAASQSELFPVITRELIDVISVAHQRAININFALAFIFPLFLCCFFVACSHYRSVRHFNEYLIKIFFFFNIFFSTFLLSAKPLSCNLDIFTRLNHSLTLPQRDSLFFLLFDDTEFRLEWVLTYLRGAREWRFYDHLSELASWCSARNFDIHLISSLHFHSLSVSEICV